MDSNYSENPMKKDGGGIRILKIGLLAAVLICACILFFTAFSLFQPDQLSLSDIYFPSPTATLTRTPTPTPTPNLTATQIAIRSTVAAQAIQTTIARVDTLWTILFLDTFSTDKNNWKTGQTDTERQTTTRSIENGIYVWDVTTKMGFIGWVTADTVAVEDFSLSVDVKQTSESSAMDSGVIFRQDTKNNYYYFGIDNKMFHVSLKYNDKWIDVIEWTRSSTIRPAGFNRLTVIAEGSHFIFLINDQVVAEATETHIPRGTTAPTIQVHGADLHAVFEFDNYELRVP